MATDDLKYVNKLAGTRVLVIGGTSGLGFTTAEAVLENGAAEVIVSSSNPERIKTTISRLQSSYPTLSKKCKILGYACDLGNEDTVEANVKTLLDQSTENGSKKLDHIVYTAGDPLAIQKLSGATIAGIRKAGSVRFFGPLMIGKLAPAYLNPGPASSITLTTGSVSQKPRPDWTIVGAFATGLHGMTRGMALDLKPIRVNLISPGAVDTELWGNLSPEQQEATKKRLAENVPTGKMGLPQDVAEAYLYVMKDQNVTGSVVSTNSGSLLI